MLVEAEFSLARGYSRARTTVARTDQNRCLEAQRRRKSFMKARKKRSNIVQRESPLSPVHSRIYPLAFPSHRLRKKYAAKYEVVAVETLPDLAAARVKVTVTINVGFVCPRRHLDATHIDVKIQRRVKRLLMAYAGRTFCAIYITFMLHIHISYLCGSALFTLIHYALLMYVNGKLSHLTSIKIANTLLHVLFYIFIMHAHYIMFLRYKIFIIFLIVDLRQISILYKCFSYNFPRKDRLK